MSNRDFLPRLLQFDWDGDTVNVSTNETLIRLAEEAMKDIYPLFYEMSMHHYRKYQMITYTKV